MLTDPLDDRRKQFLGLMENSIAPLPDAPQFQPIQPMQLQPIQDEPSQLGRGVESLGQLGAHFLNQRKPCPWRKFGSQIGNFE